MWEYYKSKTIFLTGGTGFVGTALLCRLVREASPERIYGAHETWKSLLSEQFAATLVESKRITVIDGNISATKMGLSNDTLEELKQSVNIVIHAASSINLLSGLERMARSVIAPSLELSSLAMAFPNLERFIYVSTAYCNTHLWAETDAIDVPVKEEIYHLSKEDDFRSQALTAWSDVQKTGMSNEYTSHDFPWAYAYAKHLTERLIIDLFSRHEAFEKLLIIRPSVVGPAIKYPYPGFSSPFSTPSTVLAASIFLYTGCHMRIAGRSKDPWTETTMDEVPVDVVIDRLLVHLALNTTGCVHAVSGKRGRFSFITWWHGFKPLRRLPWKLKPVWKPWDWHSSIPHPSARIYKVLGTSFAFAEDRTIDVVDNLDEKEKLGLMLFTPDYESYDFSPRKDDIRQVAMAMAKKRGLPLCLVRLLLPDKMDEQHQGAVKGWS